MGCGAALGGYRLFRSGRPGWQGVGVALYVREQQECLELCLGTGDEPAESSWMRVKGQTNVGDIGVDVC